MTAERMLEIESELDARIDALEVGGASSDLHTVMEHGAMGDGVTNDVAAVRAAVAAAGSGILTWPARHFIVNTGATPLAIPAGQRWLLLGTTIEVPAVGVAGSSIFVDLPVGNFKVYGTGAKIIGPASYVSGEEHRFAVATNRASGLCFLKGIDFSRWTAVGRVTTTAPSTYSFDSEDCTFEGVGAQGSRSLFLMSGDPSTASLLGSYLRIHRAKFSKVGTVGTNQDHGVYIYPEVRLDLEDVEFTGEGDVGTGYHVQIYNDSSSAASAGTVNHKINRVIFRGTLRSIVTPQAGTTEINACGFHSTGAPITRRSGRVRVNNSVFRSSPGTATTQVGATGVNTAGDIEFGNCDFDVTMASASFIKSDIPGDRIKVKGSRIAGQASNFYSQEAAGTGQIITFEDNEVRGNYSSSVLRFSVATKLARAAQNTMADDHVGLFFYQSADTIDRLEAFENINRSASNLRSLTGTRTLVLEANNYSTAGALQSFV